MPAAGPGHVVNSMSNTAVNGVGGYAATINTSDGGTTLSHVWGHATGGSGSLLRTEALIGTLQQTSFESFFGIDDTGSVAYSAQADDTSRSATGLDGAWLDATVLANEDDPIPSLPGTVYRFNSRVGVTNNGIAYWVAGINDAVSGASLGNGLATSASGILHKSGDLIAGLPAALGASAIDFDVRFSALGGHYLVGVDTAATSTADFFVLRDGIPLTTSAGLIGEGQAVPTDAGGLAGENWDNFDFFGINESGDYLITGDTDGATASDEFISFNGKIIYREGDAVVGGTLEGSIEGAAMNENCDIACLWDISDGSGGTIEVLMLNDKVLLREGDAVDLDGDGAIEPTSILANFTGISALTMGPNRRLYFTADIDINGTSTSSDDVEGFFFLDDPCGSSVQRHGVGCVGSTGLVPDLRLTGCVATGSTIDFSIRRGLSMGTGALLFGLDKAVLPLPGTSCALNLSPILGQVVIGLDPSGSAVLSQALGAVPSGATFTVQAWLLDGGVPRSLTASNGLRVIAE
ncbi:MAG: hypothetical protein AAF628_31330 [Planctomycetota bacterium]